MSAQRRKIARRLEKSPLLKRELSEMAVESYGDTVLSAARETGLDEKSFTSEMPWALADALRDDFILDWHTDNDEPNTIAGFFMPERRVLREIVCRIAGANQQNSLSVTAGKGSNLTCLLNVLVNLT